jgi:hypothetical protein
VVGLVDEAEAVEDTVGDAHVDGVDRGGGHGDPDVARAGLGEGDVDDLDRVGASGGADDCGAEGVGHLGSWGCVGAVRPPWRTYSPSGSRHLEVRNPPFGNEEGR